MTITLQELERSQQKSVWVMNNTPKTMEGINPGTLYSIVVNYMNEYGERSRITVPATFIPIDLTSYASKKQLLASTSFRNQVIKRNLILLSEEEAEKKLKELGNAYDKEYNRINSSRIATVEAEEAAKPDSEDDNWVKTLLGVGDDSVPNYNEADVMNKLRMIEKEITEARWKLILQFAKDDEVKEFALTHLQ